MTISHFIYSRSKALYYNVSEIKRIKHSRFLYFQFHKITSNCESHYRSALACQLCQDGEPYCCYLGPKPDPFHLLNLTGTKLIVGIRGTG